MNQIVFMLKEVLFVITDPVEELGEGNLPSYFHLLKKGSRVEVLAVVPVKRKHTDSPTFLYAVRPFNMKDYVTDFRTMKKHRGMPLLDENNRQKEGNVQYLRKEDLARMPLEPEQMKQGLPLF